jgi:hypothetical protein
MGSFSFGGGYFAMYAIGGAAPPPVSPDIPTFNYGTATYQATGLYLATYQATKKYDATYQSTADYDAEFD